MMPRCSDCGNIKDPRFPHRCMYPELVRCFELRGIVLKPEDLSLIKWLAGWEKQTCETIMSWVERAFRAGSTGITAP